VLLESYLLSFWRITVVESIIYQAKIATVKILDSFLSHHQFLRMARQNTLLKYLDYKIMVLMWDEPSMLLFKITAHFFHHQNTMAVEHGGSVGMCQSKKRLPHTKLGTLPCPPPPKKMLSSDTTEPVFCDLICSFGKCELSTCQITKNKWEETKKTRKKWNYH